jgi:hypothetical protein
LERLYDGPVRRPEVIWELDHQQPLVNALRPFVDNDSPTVPDDAGAIDVSGGSGETRGSELTRPSGFDHSGILETRWETIRDRGRSIPAIK